MTMPDDFNPNAADPAPEPYPPEVNATELLGRLLEYFDGYSLPAARFAPLICELENALDAEYRRGVEESAGMMRRTRSILDTPLPDWNRYDQHPSREPPR